jgi:putative fibronectin type III domain protein|nr:MAG TPA: contactin-3 [Caudoviricetes sp.]
MAREGDKWRVVRGDCLWNIAKAVYGNPYKWPMIADANGIPRSNPIIYPNQLFILPGITAGTHGGGPNIPPPPPPAKKVNIYWWALNAGTERSMFLVWTYSRPYTDEYIIEWWYDIGDGLYRRGARDTVKHDFNQYGFTADESAKKVQVRIIPIALKDRNNIPYWNDGEWLYLDYDFANNPPRTPAAPNVELKNNKIKAFINNIDEKLNGDTIEFVIYKDNTLKYATGLAKINKETRHVTYEQDVEPGGSYTIRCRAVRNGNIYGNWTDFSNPISSSPLPPEEIIEIRPQKINEQGAKQHGVYLEWTAVNTASKYEIQYTTSLEYFKIPGSNELKTVITEEKHGNKYLISDIQIGHEYFFRVRSINEQGESTWTAIKSTKLGERPSAPTTWSNTTNAIKGEDLNLYWTHNSTDGSLESLARINFIIKDLANPSTQPLEVTKVIRNTNQDEKNKISVYKINSLLDSEWSILKEGCSITWKVQTAGVVEEYSDWSIEREVNIYIKPSLEIDIKNQNGVSVNEINGFPFYISVLSKPVSQTPISYYLEITSNNKYESVDSTGRKIIINPGDKIYQKHYDPSTTNKWNFVAEMTPGNIDLQSSMSYTINCTVVMNSGLDANNSTNFTVNWTDSYYEVYGDVSINKDTLEASIHPYCKEWYIDNDTNEKRIKLTEKCKLSVYRREYDNTFTLIAKDINNNDNSFITDPHPSLDFARYRIVATSIDTGSISYSDIKGIRVNEPSVVIQWSEEWADFETKINDLSDDIDRKFSGSMLKIPYNVDVSESSQIDVSLIEYVGRKHPVSYYGTHVGESATWNVVIPRDDKDTIYALRRLAKWPGDVYVREPSGVGYWANISVQFGLNHLNVTVPITFSVRRVEGGI